MKMVDIFKIIDIVDIVDIVDLIIEAVWNNAKLYWSNLENVTHPINLHRGSKRC